MPAWRHFRSLVPRFLQPIRLARSLIPWAPFVVVNAPRSLVFDAFTKPEHPKRWMGPRAFPMVHCESDLRVGGGYRFVHRGSDGQEVVFHGN
jgi:hypothetical protein